MTDAERRRAVAEKVLGWHQARKLGYAALYRWCDCKNGSHYSWVNEDKLDSWQGIGLIVEAMRKEPFKLRFALQDSNVGSIIAQFYDQVLQGEARSHIDEPWIAVQEAALKAVEGR